MSLDQDLLNSFQAILPSTPHEMALAGRKKCRAHVERIDQGAILNVQKHQLGEVPGVCWELCRRWVHARLGLNGEFKRGETVLDIFPTDGAELAKLVADHQARRDAGVEGNFEVRGAKIAGSTERARGCCSFTVLRDREAVIEHMYLNPGVYIFGFAGRGQGAAGHAVAFDVAGGHLYLMDPNFGEFTLEAGDAGTRKQFKAWWRNYWGKYYG